MIMIYGKRQDVAFLDRIAQGNSRQQRLLHTLKLDSKLVEFTKKPGIEDLSLVNIPVTIACPTDTLRPYHHQDLAAIDFAGSIKGADWRDHLSPFKI